MPATAQKLRTRTRIEPTVDGCRCKPKPLIVATFRNGDLVSVTRVHNRLNRNRTPQWCPLEPEQLDIRDWGGR